MTYAWDNDSTQNAHIKQMRDDRQKAYMEKHRDDKAYERFKHMPDSGTSSLSICYRTAGVSQTHLDSHKSMRLPFMKFLKNILRNSEKSTRNI